MRKILNQLLASFEHISVAADGMTPVEESFISDITVSGLAFDSRSVNPGDLFFALPGTHLNGNLFIPAALEKGADVIVFQGDMDHALKLKIAAITARRILEAHLGLTDRHVIPAFLKVPDTRFAMAPVADSFYDAPSKKMVVIGVTGTEGKSSTVAFIWQFLRLAGKKAGFISTVQYSFGGEALDNPQHQTTPEAPVIQHHLNEMVKNGCEYAVIEASSHGLSKKLNRLGNVLFDCGVFMNVTLEHLEFHHTFEQYRNDKANLFRNLDGHDHIKFIDGKRRVVPSFGVVNLEDASFTYFMDATQKPVYGFTTDGKAGRSAAETGEDAVALPGIPDYMRYMTAKNIAAARFGISFRLETDGKDAVFRPGDDPVMPHTYSSVHINAALPGAFNAYNIMAAMIAVSGLAELPFEKLGTMASHLVPVKGRMTVIDQGQPFEVIVDYAHTPSSFETIFPPVRKRCTGRMICVFGSGGERDREKRPLQGEVAARFCDIIFLADEDPRGENSVSLLKMIAAGAEKKGKRIDQTMFIIPDRKKAIRAAFNTARQGDIVLLLGKSHENSIIYKDHSMPYDEIKEAETALTEMGYRSREEQK
ncbi:MAG: UDP-N-acetylmuramyl-tripeptide synthetase [Treponema sp.]|jgi:UDP-N-acetylmuramoyl-L-alanyl-D-glutamate--2,6-diaminopimelate ligase|nr:UDP-N-acetylmuramyl-tripeptide synthetase [Treponema sp.]